MTAAPDLAVDELASTEGAAEGKVAEVAPATTAVGAAGV
jgi:hypothetical protein